MMTSTELEMLQYLMQQPVETNNSVVVKRDVTKQTLTFLLENEIQIIEIEFLIIEEATIQKLQEEKISYNSPVLLENMLKDIEKVTVNFSHIELTVLFKKKK